MKSILVSLTILTAILLFALVSQTALAHGSLENYDRDFKSVVEGNRRLNVELVKPPNFETVGPLPLTIFLHGATDGWSTKRTRLNETISNLLRATQSDNFERRGICSLCPPEIKAPHLQLAAMLDRDFASYLLVPQIPETSSASRWSSNLDMVGEVIQDTMASYNIDPRRIYLTGFSDGGFATFQLLARHPNLFAASASIAGGGDLQAPYIADGGPIVIGGESVASIIKHVPIWLFHGSSDRNVNPVESTRAYEALRAAGGSPRITMFPGVAHDSFAPAFSDVNNTFFPWLFSQRQVPEPSSLWLLYVGLITLATLKRSHRPLLLR
jgi:predicted peptidase